MIHHEQKIKQQWQTGLSHSLALGKLKPWPPFLHCVCNLHFRPRICGGSRVLLAHMGCWGGGFCLLCRQASMARWAQYYSRGSSAANLCQKIKSKKINKKIRKIKVSYAGRFEVKALELCPAGCQGLAVGYSQGFNWERARTAACLSALCAEW